MKQLMGNVFEDIHTEACGNMAESMDIDNYAQIYDYEKRVKTHKNVK